MTEVMYLRWTSAGENVLWTRRLKTFYATKIVHTLTNNAFRDASRKKQQMEYQVKSMH